MCAGDPKDPPSALPAETLWGLLTRGTGVGVVLFDAACNYLFVNAEACRMFHGDPDKPVVGRNVAEFHTAEFTAEFVALVRRTLDNNRPIVIRWIRRGRQLQSTLWPVSEQGAPTQVMAITREGAAEPPTSQPPVEVFESQYADFGPLNPLTPRELEVLALLGQSLSIPEIAKVVVRSPRTIERHRDSIAQKLNVSERVLLAQLAAEAGLEVRDATLKRKF